jgi:hypothetical protein
MRKTDLAWAAGIIRRIPTAGRVASLRILTTPEESPDNTGATGELGLFLSMFLSGIKPDGIAEYFHVLIGPGLGPVQDDRPALVLDDGLDKVEFAAAEAR